MKNSDKVSESEIDWRIRVAEARLIARALWELCSASFWAAHLSEGMLDTVKVATWLHSEEMEPVTVNAPEGNNTKLGSGERECVLMLRSLGISGRGIAETMGMSHTTINDIIKEAMGG